jgi:hypothetical protein
MNSMLKLIPGGCPAGPPAAFVVRLTELCYELTVSKHLVVDGMPRAFANLLDGDKEDYLFGLTFSPGPSLLT